VTRKNLRPVTSASDGGVFRSSWEPVDLAPFLDGTYRPPTPTVLSREDGLCLLYRARLHSFYGESESGKSWLAQCAAAEVLCHGGTVAYLDFESDEAEVTGRMVALGVPANAILARFVYVRPDTNLRRREDEDAFCRFLARDGLELVVIDGVTDALSVFGYRTKENDDLANFFRTLPRRIARETGAAVILVDHVNKDQDSRGRFATGGQHKMAALDGAAFMVEVRRPFGRGRPGVVSVRVAKDRPGALRAVAGPARQSDRTQLLADFHLEGDPDGTVVRWRLAPPASYSPSTDGEQPGAFRPTWYMERVSEYLDGLEWENTREIRDAVKGRAGIIGKALTRLVEEHYCEVKSGRRRNEKLYRLTKPYKQTEDPQSDAFRDDSGASS